MSPPDERHWVDISNGIVLSDAERRGLHTAIDALVASKRASDLEQAQIAAAKQAVEDLHKARMALPLLALIPEIGPEVAALAGPLADLFAKLAMPAPPPESP